ncbi:MAG: hypothetical protein K8J08_19780, partial [Thermoanaerobaculia bacterium]|nr:hypothetical protein [Thermoanaerobaculia bacterium]
MSESGSQRVFWVGVGLAVLLVVLVLFWPRVAEKFEPTLELAMVAIDGGDGIARTGTVTTEAGAPARLHAVLEAKTRGGTTIYYTEAKRLEVDGVEIPADRLAVWDRSEELTVLWFTVEGTTPYLPIRTVEDLEGFHFEALFHADWPRAWSIPAAVTSRHAEHLRRSDHDRNRSFGSQRYHVRMERRDPQRPAIVLDRYKSPGPETVSELGASFPRLLAPLVGALGPASRVFGLSQLEPVTGVEGPVLEGLADLAHRDLAFSRATVLHDTLGNRAPDLEGLAWTEVT